jgi:hypothetical protein
MSEQSNYSARTPAEFTILGALWRWSLPILLVTALAAGAAWYTARSDVPLRTVQSELLVRIGYEYSPVPWSSATETQQINFRADEVIGTEIQLLTAEQTIQAALAAAPHPAIGPAGTGGYDAAQVLEVRQKLSVTRLEGSNVLLVEVTDPDEAWAIAFSRALLDAYLQDRTKFFSDPSYDSLLAEDEAATAAALEKLEAEILVIGRRVAETMDYLSSTAASLVASSAQPELRASLSREVQALQIFVDGLGGLPVMADTLQRLAQDLTAQNPLTTTAGTGSLVSDELLKEAVSQLAKDATRLSAINLERDNLTKRLDTIRMAQLRKSMRDEASHNMTVMTPPRVLATSNGIDQVQRTVLAGLMALILSSLFFVYLDGIRRRSA